MNDYIDSAVKILNEGGIIIFPTDTAFGIGCRIDKTNSIAKLFEIRKRPLSQATPVLVADRQMASNYLEEIPQDVEAKLIDKYWPGALTVVLKAKKDKVPDLVRGGSDNLGVRMPNDSTILEIIKRVGVPILGPSANFHGEQTPYSYENLNKNLVQAVDLVIPGECLVKAASTVIDCTVNPWKILRQGYINISIQ
jgi:L-threonylcarbamoyladenylate synthase